MTCIFYAYDTNKYKYIKIQSLYGENDGKDMNNYIEQSTIFATVIMHSELRGNAIPFLIIIHPLCTGGVVTK